MFPSLSPTAPDDPVVKDVSLATFKADVITASKQGLVLAAFWAPWDASCKSLVATLDKIARGSKGLVRLAKVDVDKNAPLAQQMGVQSAPSVFAFYQGRPVDAFAGEMPEAQVRAWVDRLMSAAGIGGGESKPGLETALAQAADFMAARDFATAQSIYADILDMEPANVAAYSGLMRCLIAVGEVAAARHMLDQAPDAVAKDKGMISAQTALELAEQAAQGAGQAAELEAKIAQDPAAHQARYDLALAYYAAGRREDAVDQLLEIVRRARSWNEDAARKQLVKFFEAFGATDPLTESARKRLSSLLFS